MASDFSQKIHDMKKNVRLQDIADALGVSRNTVSLALRDSPRISTARRKAIADTAEAMGYRPHHAARQLARRRSGLIGLFTTSLYDAVRMELVNDLMKRLHDDMYRPILGLSGNQAGLDHASPWIATFQELAIEALVLLTQTTTSVPDWAGDMPVIAVGGNASNARDCDRVSVNRVAAGRQAAQHLIERGCEYLLVTGSRGHPFIDAAVRAQTDAVPCESIWPVPINHPQLLDHLEQAIADAVAAQKGKHKKLGLVMGDAPLAAMVMDRLLNRGLRIPDDLAVVSYDYYPPADVLKVPLTTIVQPIAEMVEQTVTLVRRRLADPSGDKQQVVLDHTVIQRASS